MLSRFSCVSIITQNCSGTKVCFVQTFVPKSLFSAVRIGGEFLIFYNKSKNPPLILLSITIRITRNVRVQQLVKVKYNMQSLLCAVSISSLHTNQFAAIAA